MVEESEDTEVLRKWERLNLLSIPGNGRGCAPDCRSSAISISKRICTAFATVSSMFKISSDVHRMNKIPKQPTVKNDDRTVAMCTKTGGNYRKVRKGETTEIKPRINEFCK